MRAYIKYCGGCNETFSRPAAAARIKQAFNDRIEFVRHDSPLPCEIGVLIEGCAVSCVDRQLLAPCEKLVEICADSDVDIAISELDSFLNNREKG